MPKPPTFPNLYNEALQINVSKLKGWGYLDPNQLKKGTLNWSIEGRSTGSISIQVNTRSEHPYIELDYNYKGEPRNYKVNLTSTTSNLKKGLVWYFICPRTKKRCRKLYSFGGYFLHREAFTGCMYEVQTKSKKNRQFERALDFLFKADEVYSKLNAKHFKTTYAGQPTKQYLRLIHQLEKIERLELLI